MKIVSLLTYFVNLASKYWCEPNSEVKIRLSALDIGLDKLPAIARALCPPRDGLDGTVSHGAMLASMVHAMGSWCIGLG